MKEGEKRKEVCEGETAESSSRLTVAFSQGSPPGGFSKEPWNSKEHSLKTIFLVSLEWQGVFIIVQDKQAKDSLNPRHCGLGMKRVCLKASLITKSYWSLSSPLYIFGFVFHGLEKLLYLPKLSGLGSLLQLPHIL